MTALQLEICDLRADRRGSIRALVNSSRACVALGGHEKAVDFRERALEIQEEMGDRRGAARSLIEMGTAYDRLSSYPRALECYERALAILERIEC